MHSTTLPDELIARIEFYAHPTNHPCKSEIEGYPYGRLLSVDLKLEANRAYNPGYSNARQIRTDVFGFYTHYMEGWASTYNFSCVDFY